MSFTHTRGLRHYYSILPCWLAQGGRASLDGPRRKLTKQVLMTLYQPCCTACSWPCSWGQHEWQHYPIVLPQHFEKGGSETFRVDNFLSFTTAVAVLPALSCRNSDLSGRKTKEKIVSWSCFRLWQVCPSSLLPQVALLPARLPPRLVS